MSQCQAQSAGPTVFKLCEYIPIMARDLNKGPFLITLLANKKKVRVALLV